MNPAMAVFVQLLFVLVFLEIRRAMTASFYGDSSIRLPFDDRSTSVSLELRFLTHKASGLLFLSQGQTDFLSLHLVSGLLEIQGNFGSGLWTLSSASGIRLDDQSWHHVVVIQRGKNMTLIIDNASSSASIPGDMTRLNKDEVFIGGVDPTVTLTKTWKYFRGCISNIFFSRYDILRHAQQLKDPSLVKHISWDCSSEFLASSSDVMFIKGDQSYVAFPHLSIQTDGSLAFDLKTQSTTTFFALNVASNLSNSDLLAIEIIGGKIKLTANRGGSDMVMHSNLVINDNHWHSVEVTFEPQRAILQVDAERQQAAFDSSSNTAFKFSKNFFIGGLSADVKSHITNQNLLMKSQLNQNFRGCVRNLNVNSELMGFRNAEISNDVGVGCNGSEAEVAPNQGDSQDVDEASRREQTPIQVVPLRGNEGEKMPITENVIKIAFNYRRYRIRESAIQFRITQPPSHGTVEIDRRWSSDAFTLLDLKGQKVSYQHDGSETTSDEVAMEMMIASGSGDFPEKLMQTYAFVLPIIITSKDDLPVVYLLNTTSTDTSMEMAKNSKITLTTHILNIIDPDTAPSSSIFVTNCLSATGIPGYLEMSGRVIRTFTFQELRDGLVSFSIQYEETTCTFNISSVSVTLRFAPVDLRMFLAKRSGLRLVQGSYAVITPDNLTVSTNLLHQNLNIQYEITRNPRYGEIQVRDQSSWSTTPQFTQSDIQNGNVRYIHTKAVDMAPYDQFSFIVHCLTESLSQMPFFVQVERLSLDVTVSRSINLSRRDYKVLTTSDLNAQTNDRTMPDNHIRFVLRRPPARGSIYRVHKKGADPDLLSDLQPLQSSEYFTQEDISNGFVIYKLNQALSVDTNDFVDMRVEAGSAARIIRMYFDYTPPKTGVIFTNNGLRTVIEGGQRTIQKSDLYLETKDYTEFEFNVMDLPEHGTLEFVIPRTHHVVEQNVSKFTNQDIRNQRLVYHHDDSENDKDKFTFIASPVISSTDALPLKVQEFSGTFQVKVIMRNDNPPVRLADKVFDVVTNQGRVITLDDLAFTDPDIDYNSMNLVYHIESVSNGEFVYNKNNSRISRFKQQDIAAGIITFRHSNDSRGQASCSVNDGQFYTHFMFEISAASPFVKVVNNTGILVKNSQSVIITNNNLSVETNENVGAGNIRFILIEKPLFGKLEVRSREVMQFSLQMLLDGILAYRHNGRGGSQDVVKFAVLAGQARVQSSFVVQIFQTIQNYPPRVVHNSILEVPEQGSATLSTSNLQVTHPNSAPSDIIYAVKTLPSHGKLQLLSQYQPQNGHTTFRFTQEDIDNGHVKYNHSNTNSSVNPSADSFMFDVTNGMQTLRGLHFAIEIVQTRLKLEIRNLTVQEGSRKTLTTNNIRLKSRYYDGKTIRFTIIKQPTHGWLEEAAFRNQPLSTFTFAQLSQGRIFYVHDHSESVTDSFTVKGQVLEDRKDTREGEVFISVQTINDQSPRLVVNKALAMWRSSLALITKDHLMCEDTDSGPREVLYHLLGSTNGRVALLNNTFHNIQSFTQDQVNQGQVVFVHEGADEGGFSFYISDGTNSDRKRQFFKVTAQPLTLKLVKNSALKVYPDKSQTLLPENLLTKTNDPNQTKPIIYHIQQKPRKGKIVTKYKDQALEVMSFKQEDVDNGKIMYQHDSYLTTWTDTDSFTFEVRTLYAEPIENQLLQIQISYGNFHGRSQNDDIHIEGFVVQEGGEHILTQQNIDITNYTRHIEQEGKQVKVWYSLLTTPTNGELHRDKRIISHGDRFLQNEINRGEISYRHDNSDTHNDSFVFNVHVEIQEQNGTLEVQEMKETFNISILPLNDQPFRLISENPIIEVVEGMSALVSSDVLNTVDLDTPPSGILYKVRTSPFNGILAHVSAPMFSVKRFTQKDINEGRLKFTQHGTRRSGSFQVDVSDGKFPPVSAMVTVSIIPVRVEVTSNRTIYILQAETSVSITKDNLDITTNGNRQKVHYRITTAPRFGQIFQHLYPVTFFKQVDIDKGSILYIQRNLSSHIDSFYCDIYYEGSAAVLRNRKVIVMVKPRLNQNPVSVITGGQVALTTYNLDASQLANLTGNDPRYTLIEKPKYGHIVKAVRNKREDYGRSRYKQVDYFTHEDILYVKIFFLPGNLPYQGTFEDSFSFLLSARGVQPALGSLRLYVAKHPGYTTSTGRHPYHRPEGKDNSTLFSEEPVGGEIVSPNVSPDFFIILAILIPLFVLVIIVIILVFIMWRRHRYSNYSPPGSRDMQRKSRFRPDISGPMSLEQPHVHIQLQEGATAADDNHSLVYEHHNYLNVPINGQTKHYVSDQGHSDGDDLDTQSDDESNATSPLVDPNMTEISATVPECKVTPLLSAQRRPKERGSRCSLDLFDWSMIEDSEFLQHCRTTTPVLRDSQYWV